MPPHRRRRWLRWLLITFTLLLCLVLAAPHAIALGPVRAEVERQLSATTGAPCRIGRMGFSWFSGVAIRELEIGNPAGFPNERPALRIGRAALDLGLGALLRGQFRCTGSVQGLEVFVEQRADGTTNLQGLVHVEVGASDPPEAGTPPRPDAPTAGDGDRLRDLQCDLQILDSTLELRREGRLLEALSGLGCRVQKELGSEHLQIEFDSKLRPTTDQGDTGRLGAKVDVDLQRLDVDAMLSTSGLDLGRYGPLVDTFLPGQLTALAGIANGTLRVIKLGDGVQLDGDLAIGQPHLAGPLVRGMDLRGSRWTLQPALKLDGATADNRRFLLDLGWLQLRGADAPAGVAARFQWQLDVEAMAAFGGPMPALLRGSGANASGTIDLVGETLPSSASELQTRLRATTALLLPRLDVQGFALRDLAADATYDGVTVTAVTRETTRLDAGPLQLLLECRLDDLATLPVKLSMRWRDGQLQGGAAGALRYLVPLLAGPDGTANGLTGRCDFEVALLGPGRPAADENWLQWLDRWTGDGRIALHGAAFEPARGLGGLLAPLGPLAGPDLRLGDAQRLALDDFEAPFRFAQGAIVTTAGKWLAKGRTIGLSGTVRLDGGLDYGLDLTALLRGHRDGDRVLQALGGTLPAARLQGTVLAPALGLPDLATVLQKVATRELQQRGTDLLKKELEDLLRRSKKR
ncbi:MAG: AsmA-like C-terminal region-containing protein [Planctomycetes bacterium]|jgi:hypothetical protein|nr:AsmA-like C-terminal region-containing protein [Planctomycetota bacterium]